MRTGMYSSGLTAEMASRGEPWRYSKHWLADKNRKSVGESDCTKRMISSGALNPGLMVDRPPAHDAHEHLSYF